MRFFRTDVACVATILLALALAGCDEHRVPPQPLDVLRFPTDLAVSGTGEVLYVVGANFDRRYEAGVLQAVDLAALDAAVDGVSGDGPVQIDAVPWVGGVHIGAFGGRIARADTGNGTERIFVPIRGEGTVAVIDASADGVLACHPDGGDDCRAASVPLPAPSGVNVSDPFAAVVVHGHLYVAGLTLQRQDETDRASPLSAHLARLPVDRPESVVVRSLGRVRTRDLRMGPDGLHLWAIGIRQETDRTVSEIRSFTATTFETEDLSAEVRSLTSVVGATDGRALAFSTDGRRAHALTRSPSALVVFDVVDGASSLRTRATLPLPRAPSRIALVESDEARLAVITATEDDALVLVDLDRNEVVAVLDGTRCDDLDAPCPAGNRQREGRDPRTDVGLQPWAAVPVPRADGGVRIWVGSFGDGTLRAVDVADLRRPWRARVVAVVRDAAEEAR